MRAAHFCQECGKVQPPAPVDYFTFFGLPFRLNLETRKTRARILCTEPALASRHQRRQQRSRTALEPGKEFAAQRCLPHLKDPITRTEYLLRLQGVQMEEQSKAATEEARRTGKLKKQVVPPDLLEQVFELNMQLEEMRMNKKMGELDRDLRARATRLEEAVASQVQRPSRRVACSMERLGCLDRPRRARRQRIG